MKLCYLLQKCSFLLIKLATSMAWIKQQTAEYRMTKDEGWNSFAKSFLKQTEYIHSMFDVERSMFISFFFDQSGSFIASGWAEP